MTNHPQETFNPDECNDWFAKYPWFERMIHNGKIIAVVLLGVVIVFTLYFQFIGSSSSEEDYFRAERDFTGLNSASQGAANAQNQQTYLKNLESLVLKHPDLQAKYDGFLGQWFLNRGDLPKAQPYIARTLARTQSDHLAYYADFAKTSELIVKKDYTSALSASKDLQSKMANRSASAAEETEKNAFGDILFQLNLMRIATLSGLVGDRQSEINSWKELAASAKLNASNSDRSVISTFSEGKFSLDDYIKWRLQALKP